MAETKRFTLEVHNMVQSNCSEIVQEGQKNLDDFIEKQTEKQTEKENIKKGK